MAAVDPIVYAQLCKLFPMLTTKQIINHCFYSIGANYNEISSLQEATSAAVKKSLESSQKYFHAKSLTDLRIIFWGRFALRQIYRKYSISSDSLDVLTNPSVVTYLSKILPELNSPELTCVTLFTIGMRIEDICVQLSLSAITVEQTLSDAMVLLKVETPELLRMVAVSRMLVDLC